MKKLLLLSVLFLGMALWGWGQTNVFSENMGTPSATTLITSYTGWQNNGILTFTGSGDVRNTTVSNGYTGASGGGNVFLTNTIGKDFQISSINTSSYTSLALSFGIFKSTTSGNGSDLIVEVSSDGSSYTSLSYTSLPTGTGTAIWFLRTATGNIPSSSNLRIRFRQNGSTTQYRIDDVILAGISNASSGIITLSPLTQNFDPFCNSIANSVSLTYTTSGTVTSPFIELSNSSGSFASGTANLGGTVTIGPPNTITTSIPQNQDPGAYKIRIMSTDIPPVVSLDNGSNILITGAVTPSVTINDPGSVCPTQSVTFTPVPLNLGGGAASYSWIINGVTGSASGDTYTQSVWETGNSVQAVMTVTGGCVTSATALSNLVAPTVTSNTPSVSIAITSGTNPTCAGSSITFTATPANLGGGTVSYQWKKNGSNDGTNSPTYLLTPDNNDQVSCEITVTGGCVTSNSATSGTTTITVNQIPATPVTSSNSPICAGGTLNLTSNATGTISWTGPNSFISSEQNPSIENVTSATGGTYNVTSTVDGCTSLAGNTSVVIYVAPAIITHPVSVSITEGNSHTFTIVASGTGLTYKWFENSIEIPLATSSSYTVTGATLGMSGYSYICEVTGTCAPSVTSNVAILTVIQPPIAGWDMSTQLTYGISPLTATFTADNITVGQLTKGSGIMGGGTAAARAWGGGTSSTWAISSEASIANGAYFTFTVQANSEYSLSLSAINPFDYRRSPSGPPSGLIQYKLNSGIFIDITTVNFLSSSSTGGSIGSIDLNSISELQNLTPSTLVTFRVVLYGAAPGGTWYIFDKANSTANDFALIGTVSLLTITTTTTADNKSVCSGTTSVNLTATVSPDPGGGTIQFKIDGGNVGSPQEIQSGGTASYIYDPSALGAGDHTIEAYFSGNGSYLASSGSGTLTVNPTATVDGYFKYYNSANTSLNSVSIELKQSGVYKYGASTNSSGYFEFPNVCPGTYDVVASKTKVNTGVNSTDAAQVNYWAVHNSFIENVRFLAGDVNGDLSVLSGDASHIQQYFITQGNPVQPFDSDWSFWKTGDLINANPGPSGYPTITVPAGSSTVTQNFYGLVTGDFNRSYVPGSMKSGSESLGLIYGDVTEVGLEAEFELPLYAMADMEVGAISLILEFPSDLMEVNDVFLSDDPNNPVPYLVSGDELRIGWNSLTPLMVQEGEPLVILLLKVNEPAGEEGIRFKLAADPLNELADGSFEVIGNAVLLVDVIKTTATGFDENTLTDKLTLSNRPNPFRGTTSFSYSLPMDGKVTLVIHDVIGNKVKVLVDEMQTAGDYQLKMEVSDLQPGVYTATIRVESFGDVVGKTIKIINKNN